MLCPLLHHRTWHLLWTGLLGSLVTAASAGCGAGSNDPGGAASPCAVGQQLCGAVCVSVESDPANCGACGVACEADAVCSNGTCTSECGLGQTLCDRACVDTSTDPSHCGGCSLACGAGEQCVAGSCQATEAATGGAGSGEEGSGGAPSSSGGAAPSSGGAAAGGMSSTGGSSSSGPPASNPNADCAARSLLQYLYDLTGSNILSGQESMFSDGSFPSRRDSHVYNETGKYPAVYSSDFGDVRTNNLHNRQDVVDNALGYARRGSIIQLHNHMIQPDLPDGSGFDAMSSFEGDYSRSNIDEILTPGSSLNQEHLSRLDEIAGYLRQLQNAGVAVLWRPFHEMNGGWFWWGQQPRFAELWIQMWEHFTNQHGLDHLLWVFSVNHWDSAWGDGPDAYYPGHDYVDVLGVDVYLEYGHNYQQYVHDELLSLGGGKPIAFTENGEMPNVPSLSGSQPSWVYWATWWGFEGADSGNTSSLYSTNYSDPRTITQDEVNVPACPD